MYVIYAEWSSWEISSGEARGSQASPSGGRNFCYRQVLPLKFGLFFYFSTQMYVIYAEWSSWEISSGEARGAQASPSGGRNFCYRQVLPITTISVQRPSLLKSSQARIQSNGSKRIMSRKTWSRIMSRKTWPRVVWCFSMTGQGARQPDAIKHPSNISTDLTIKQLHNLCN